MKIYATTSLTYDNFFAMAQFLSKQGDDCKALVDRATSQIKKRDGLFYTDSSALHEMVMKYQQLKFA